MPESAPKVEIRSTDVELRPSPIQPEWILEGDPQARGSCVSRSADGTASTHIWDCTAGRFNWYYGVDETVYILEGSVTLRYVDGSTHIARAGDTVFFPAGSQAEWTIERYIKKVAFLRVPLSSKFIALRRIKATLQRLIGRASPAESGGLS